jgi:hypothetical protein
VLEPELLDELQPSDPRAKQSRRDLSRINWWMGNPARIACALNKRLPVSSARIADLGAGDGDFSLEVAQRLQSSGRRIDVTLVDRQNASADNLADFRKLGWKAESAVSDVFVWLDQGQRFDAIYANLFLHHFTAEQLAVMFEKIAQRTDYFVACEPRRYRFSTLIRWSMKIIGCSEVTQSDGVISVRAGFREGELSARWPKNPAWTIVERRGGVFGHFFEARKAATK